MQSVKVQAVDKGPLSVEEFDEAEKAISFCQCQRFPEELACLQNGERVKKSNHLYNLDPILENGVLRVGGRILAKDLHLSTLILNHVHQVRGHGGQKHTLSQLRQKYWIPGACVAIRKTMSKCVVCRRLNAAPANQYMADLPHDRVSPDEPPFTRAGVDCF